MTASTKVVFTTSRIANLVAEVQAERKWEMYWEILNMYFRNPSTFVSAKEPFKKMFLEKLKTQDLKRIPPCYELGEVIRVYEPSDCSKTQKQFCHGASLSTANT